MYYFNAPFFGVVAGALVLSGCSSSSGSSLSTFATRAEVVSVSSGRADVALSSELNNSVSDPSVGLVAYATGVSISRGQAVAVVGIESANVGAPVTTGTATYVGRYGFGIVDAVRRTDTQVAAQRQHVNSQPITLTADFDQATLTGANTVSSSSIFGQAHSVSVNGTIAGQTLSGTVDVTPPSPFISGLTGNPIQTELSGSIGSTGVVGIFIGADDDTAVAGGFVAARQ